MSSYAFFFRPKSASGQNQEGQAKAKFNFQSLTPMELSLIKGCALDRCGECLQISAYNIVS